MSPSMELQLLKVMDISISVKWFFEQEHPEQKMPAEQKKQKMRAEMAL